MKTFLLIGNFGVGNLGDEMLKEYFLTHVPDVRWQVVSANPLAGELPRLPGGLRSFGSFRWIRTLKAMRHCDGVVFGGGTLFTDAESIHACFIWWMHAFAARMCGAPRIFAFQGVGPFHSGLGEWFFRSAVQHSLHISVRDTASYSRVKDMHLSTEIIQSFDPVFCLLEGKNTEIRSQKILGVIPRSNSAATMRNALEKCMNKNTFDSIVILSLQPDNCMEKKVCRDIASNMHIEIRNIRTADEFAESVGSCSRVITERYHGAVAALALGVPFESVARVDGDKLATVGTPSRDECAKFVAAGERGLRRALGIE